MERTSNFELLRLILMLMIVIHHCIVVGLGIEGLCSSYDLQLAAVGRDVPTLLFTNCFCIVAVNVFVLISGYFGIRIKLRKVLLLLFAIYFYTIFFTTLPLITYGNVRLGLYKLAVFSQQPHYWFLREYFILLLFCPFINEGLERFSKKNHLIFVLGLTFVSCYLGYVFGRSVNHNGYNFVNFILLYVLGSYIKRYPVKGNGKIWGLTYVVTTLVIALLSIYFYQEGKYGLVWKLTYYNNPLVIVASLALFLAFRSVNIRSKRINKIAQSSISIYLFGCSVTILRCTCDLTKFSYAQLHDNMGIFILSLVGISLATAILAIAIDQIRLYAWHKIENLTTSAT